MQIVSHIPLNNINFPRVFMGFLKYVNQVVGFKRTMPTDWHVSPTPPVNTNFYWMGYETMSFFENMGFVTILLLLLVIRQAFAFLFIQLEKICCCTGCFKGRRDLLVSSPTESMNVWTRFFLMTYFEFGIACCAGVQIEEFLPLELTFADKVSISM